MTTEESVYRRLQDIGGSPADDIAEQRLMLTSALMLGLLRIPDVSIVLYQRKEAPVLTLLAEYSPERHVIRAFSFYRFDYAPKSQHP